VRENAIARMHFQQLCDEALEFYEFDAGHGEEQFDVKISDPEWSLYNWTLSARMGALLALAKKLRAQDEAEIQICRCAAVRRERLR